MGGGLVDERIAAIKQMRERPVLIAYTIVRRKELRVESLYIHKLLYAEAQFKGGATPLAILLTISAARATPSSALIFCPSFFARRCISTSCVAKVIASANLSAVRRFWEMGFGPTPSWCTSLPQKG